MSFEPLYEEDIELESELEDVEGWSLEVDKVAMMLRTENESGFLSEIPLTPAMLSMEHHDLVMRYLFDTVEEVRKRRKAKGKKNIEDENEEERRARKASREEDKRKEEHGTEDEKLDVKKRKDAERSKRRKPKKAKAKSGRIGKRKAKRKVKP